MGIAKVMVLDGVDPPFSLSCHVEDRGLLISKEHASSSSIWIWLYAGV
jgi:hypothetical protein